MIEPWPIFDIAIGYWASQALFSATELGLFTQLSDSSATEEEVAQRLHLPSRPARMLLEACASLGLLRKEGKRYANTDLAQAFLVEGDPQYVGGFLRFLNKREYACWGKLLEALKTNRPQRYNPDAEEGFDSVRKSPEEAWMQTLGMHGLSIYAAHALAEAFDFSPYKKLVDAGGGSGAICIAVASKYPHIQAVIFDLEPVCQITEEIIACYGLSDRVRTHPGDFFQGGYPEGTDIVTLSHILHDWGFGYRQRILENIHAALPLSGAILVNEWLLNEEKAGPKSSALMSLNMLVEGGARQFTGSEIGRMLEDVGFTEIEVRPLTGPNGIVVGKKR